jgi:hypothetical protein
MRRKLRTAMRFSACDWGLLLQAWLLLVAVDLGLRGVGFKRVQAFAAGTAGETRDGAEAAAVIRRVGRLVDAAARHHVYAMTCLRRALVLQRLLGARGVETELRLGVERERDALRAHAWLERGGRVIGEAASVGAEYAVLVAQGAAR